MWPHYAMFCCFRLVMGECRMRGSFYFSKNFLYLLIVHAIELYLQSLQYPRMSSALSPILLGIVLFIWHFNIRS